MLTDTTADTAMTLLLMVARRVGEGEREPRHGIPDTRRVHTVEEVLEARGTPTPTSSTPHGWPG